MAVEGLNVTENILLTDLSFVYITVFCVFFKFMCFVLSSGHPRLASQDFTQNPCRISSGIVIWVARRAFACFNNGRNVKLQRSSKTCFISVRDDFGFCVK